MYFLHIKNNINRKKLENLPSVSVIICLYQVEEHNDQLLKVRFYLGVDQNQWTERVIAPLVSSEIVPSSPFKNINKIGHPVFLFLEEWK